MKKSLFAMLMLTAAFLLIFGLACYLKAERMEKVRKKMQEIEQKQKIQEQQIKETGDRKFN